MGIYKDKDGNIRHSRTGNIEKVWVVDNPWTGKGHFIDNIPSIQTKRIMGCSLYNLRGLDVTDETCGSCPSYDGIYKWENGRKWCHDGGKYIYSKKQPACINWGIYNFGSVDEIKNKE